MGPKRPIPFARKPKAAPLPKVAKIKDVGNDFFVILDTAIVNDQYGGSVTSKLSEGGLKFQVRNQLLPQSISFERKTTNDEMDEENIMLLILQGSDVIAWMEQDTLISTVKSFCDTYPEKNISLLIFGFRKFLRGGHSKMSRVQLETQLTKVQLYTKCSHRLIEKEDVLADTIVHFSKATLEWPVKKLKNEALENQNFYFEGDNKECVKVSDKVGLGRLWQQHLIKLPFITLETAEAIMTVYPTPKTLLDALKNSDSPETLLRDIPFRRGNGPLVTNRRIGPEMSSKIYKFYTSLNGDELLSTGQ